MKIIESLDSAKGGGKYDEVCMKAFKETESQGVLLIVIGGKEGHGFSAVMTREINDAIPGLLRKMADDIESDRRKVAQS